MARNRGVQGAAALFLGAAIGLWLGEIAGCATQAAMAQPLPANYELWVKVGQCEQPGKGHRGVNWSHPGPTYQGGLGFYAASWDQFKPKGYPANAGAATWRQQMIVANRLYRAVGWGWGCDPR